VPLLSNAMVIDRDL